MIRVVVTSFHQATIRLMVRGPTGQAQEIEAVIDTGVDGALSLAPADIAALGLPWRRRGRALLADGTTSLFDISEATVLSVLVAIGSNGQTPGSAQGGPAPAHPCGRALGCIHRGPVAGGGAAPPPYNFEGAIGIAVRECAEALVVLSSPLFLAQRARSAELVVKNHLPATFFFREYAEVGGLMA